MGYSVFAGNLAMYYAGDYPGAPEQPPFDRDQLLAAVRQWQEAVASKIPGCRGWDERYGAPYLQANLGLDAFGALLLRVSCAITGTECPATIPSGWRFYEDGTVDEVMSAEGSVLSSLIADIWLPSPEVGLLQCVGPAGNQITVSTLATLHRDLVAINQAVWSASGEDIVSWSDSYPGSEGVLDTDRLARFAFSVLVRLVVFAEGQGRPIIVGH